MVAQRLNLILARIRRNDARRNSLLSLRGYAIAAALAVLATALFPVPVIAAPPAPGDVVTNTANLTFTGGAANATATATAVIRTASSIEFLQYGAAAPGVYVPVPECDSGSGYAPLPAPVVGGTTLPVPGSLGLAAASSYATDEAIFVRVTDADQNTDPLTAQTVLVQLNVAATGDSETIRLTETGANTGVFVGYIQATTAPAANDCRLSVVAAQPVAASYTDINDPADTASATAPVGSGSAGIFLSNSAQKSSTTIGEVVPYQVDITNTTTAGITGTLVTVALPAGFRYRPGSATLDGTPVADPSLTPDGRTLTFAVGPVAASATTTLRYVATVTAGAHPGVAVNSASATATGAITSNVAQAQLIVEEEPIISRGLVMGRVMVGNCQARQISGEVGIRLRSKAVADRVHYEASLDVAKLGVEEVQLVVRLPDVLAYIPGSAILDGKKLSDPGIDGKTLRFDLGHRDADSKAVLAFDTRSQLRVFGEFTTIAYSEFSTRASAGFRTEDQVSLRTPVAVNRVKDYSRIVRPRFDTLSTDLKEKDKRQLDDLAASLAGQAVKRIYIIGHADAQPIVPGSNTPFANNEALARARANRVVQYLQGKLNLDAGKFDISSEGDRRPVYYSKRLAGRELTPAERFALNRRVEVLVEMAGGDAATRFLVSRSDSGLKSAPVFPHYATKNEPTVGEGIPGAQGIRLYLEDGQFVETDKQGMYHFDGLRPGTHVVQIDTASLPDHLELDRCEENTRFAGTPNSRFVEVRPGSLLRADFYLKRKPPTITNGSIGIDLQSRLDKQGVRFTLTASGDTVDFNKRQFVIHLPEGLEYIPGSASLDGAGVADPARDAGAFVFDLGDRSGSDWKQTLRFRARAVQAQEGEYATYAYMKFETRDGKPHRSAVAETTLLRQAVSVRRFVYDAAFRGTGVKLAARDKEKLDEIVDYLRGKNIRSVYVESHSDNGPVPVSYQDRFADKYQLSAARAVQVGDYLSHALRLYPQQLRTAGLGPDKPIASNATAGGRVRNNRIELYVTLVDDRAPYSVKINRPDSGLQLAGVANSTPYPEKVAPEQKDVKPAHPSPAQGVLDIRDGDRIAVPVMAVRVRLDSRLKPDLRIDGTAIPVGQIGFKKKDASTGSTIYTYIGVNLGDPGDHMMSLKGMDPFGNARVDQTVKYVRTSAIAEIRVVQTSGNVADGKTPVKLRVELLDQQGNIIHAATTLKLKDSELVPHKPDEQLPELRTEPDAVQVSANGEILFEPVTASGTRTGKLYYNNISIDFRTYVRPVYRDWIMVGIAEGTLAHKKLTGNMQNLSAADQKDSFFQDGRLAFFAKGKIKGKYLLTLAYDSTKTAAPHTNGLFQQIDPNKYYTLYGDGTQQRGEAPSSSPLYVKLESDQFYILFGDYKSGLTVTELSRYDRTLTGFKAEYRGERVRAQAFASDSGSAYVKDEIPGDGTSGLYRLSKKNIVVNSDRVRIEVRDRFHSETILQTRQLVRYVDYQIDPIEGTLYFKEPIYNRDPDLNPVYIVAEYEVDGSANSVTAGGRAALVSRDGKREVGATVIHQGSSGADGNLVGADAKFRFNGRTELRAEIASSDENQGGTRRKGGAYIAELNYHGEKMDLKAYAREHDPDFGLGQQNASETGTQKTGVTGTYHKTRKLSFNGEVFHDVNLVSGATRDVVDTSVAYKTPGVTLTGGYRHASDTISGTTYESDLLTGSAIKSYFDNKLKFHTNVEVSVSGDAASPEYPDRLVTGAEYLFTPKSSLFVNQELTFGSNQDSNTTRVGIKTSPWKGASLGSSVQSEYTENGTRVFSDTGLTQGIDLKPNLHVDFGLERVQTLRHSGDPVFDPDVPPASGTRAQDFSAATAGLTYKQKLWSATGRFEYRDGELYDKAGVLLGFYRQQTPGFGLSGSLNYFDTKETSGDRSRETTMNFAFAYRPTTSRWIVLDKLELSDKYSLTGAEESNLQKFVNNISANYMFDRSNQLTLHYGYKYTVDTLDASEYSGSTQFLGSEYRHDIRKDWDMGLHFSALQSQLGNNRQYSYGVSVGYNMAKNTWISLGYNFDGFNDDDFSAAGYTAAGSYIKIRFSFDQNTSRDVLAWWEKHRGIGSPASGK